MAASSADDLTIYTGTTPNGKKVILAAEELGLQYTPKLVNTSEREQFEADFVAINPNSKFPAIVDKRSGEEIKVWESAAILIHLAEVAKSDLLPTAPAARADVMKWTIFQAANIGPHCGNLFHFATQKKMGPEDYPIQRYGGEVQRLFNVMDKQLASNAYLAGDAYSLADVISFHWVQGFFTFLPAMLPAIGEAYDFADESKYTNLRAWVAKVAERPAVKKTAEVYEAAPFKKAE